MLDQLKLRKFVEKSLYQSSKAGFKTLSQSQKAFKFNKNLHKQRLANQSKSLFDLSLTPEQQMACDAMEQFAAEVLYPLAHREDQEEKFPAEHLGDDNFSYTAFADLGNLMWCAMAAGACEAVKKYYFQYPNGYTAFGEPILHRQSVAFMMADAHAGAECRQPCRSRATLSP